MLPSPTDESKSRVGEVSWNKIFVTSELEICLIVAWLKSFFESTDYDTDIGSSGVHYTVTTSVMPKKEDYYTIVTIEFIPL